MRRSLTLTAVAAAAALALTACGGGGDDPLAGDTGGDDGGDAGSVTVGSANFPGNVLLAELYASALEADGVTVSTTLNIGSRETYIPALEDGSIDLIPEYSGALLTYLDAEATPGSPEDILAALPDVLPEGTTILDPAAAEDRDSITVSAETAEEYSLTSIADLAPVAGDLTLGAPAEFETRSNGVPGLDSVYGVTFGEFRAFDASGNLTVQSLVNGQVDAANIYTSDPSIAANDLVVLEDPESLFPAQQIIPLITSDAATDGVSTTLNEVSAALSQEALQEMMGRVITDGEDPGTVAQEWVDENLA